MPGELISSQSVMVFHVIDVGPSVGRGVGGTGGRVAVGTSVGVGDRVRVAVDVGVGVLVGVEVRVAVGVFVVVEVFVAVGVGGVALRIAM